MKTKAQNSFAVTAKLISAFVFAKRIVQLLFFFTPKFQASSLLLWLYREFCVRPGRKPRRPIFLASRLMKSPLLFVQQYLQQKYAISNLNCITFNFCSHAMCIKLQVSAFKKQFLLCAAHYVDSSDVFSTSRKDHFQNVKESRYDMFDCNVLMKTLHWQ